MLCSATSCLPAEAADPSLSRFEYSEVAMGVRARIVVYAAGEKSATRACRAAFERIAYLEDVMSDYRPTSELMRLCSKAGGPPVPVSPELLFILRKSEDLSRRSDGAFDVTIGPLVKLWRKARKSRVLPTEEEIAAARKLVGWRKVVIDPKARTVRLKVRGMQLDLGGIAKGYACDEALRVLGEHGIENALVEMGGNIAVSGPPPGKKGWEIEIESATDPARNSVILSRAAVSSSGDTEQYVEMNGIRYSHIVDPRTGLGLTDRIAATIIAPDGVTADGLSTAVSVLGVEKGRALVKTFPGVSAYIISRQASFWQTISITGPDRPEMLEGKTSPATSMSEGIESLNGKMRDELPNAGIFDTLAEATGLTEAGGATTTSGLPTAYRGIIHRCREPATAFGYTFADAGIRPRTNLRPGTNFPDRSRSGAATAADDAVTSA